MFVCSKLIFYRNGADDILLAGFIFLSEWSTVMVAVSLFIINHTVCVECVCVSVRLAPGLCQPITPSLFCVCVRVGCVLRPY